LIPSPNNPRVTVLLPAYNAAATLRATIDSILAQTFPDFELLILDDASTDATPDILHEIRDPRLRLHRNPANLELTRTLNVGLSLSRGTYIARIDADDLCLPERVARQVAFLDAHPHIAVVGTFVDTFSDNNPAAVWRYPTEPPAVAAALLFRNPLAHPAVMLRRAALEQHHLRYDDSIRRGQDYDLWCRCHLARLSLANIPEVLLRYRVHEAQATRVEPAGVRQTSARVRQRLLENLGLTPTPEELALHEALAWDQLVAEPRWLQGAVARLERLYRANLARPLFDIDALGRVLCGRWVRTLNLAHQTGIALPAASPLAQYLLPGALHKPS
jgi:glycosyltransferase involved in cell wall biosynthesis